jgi:hypothetical protein
MQEKRASKLKTFHNTRKDHRPHSTMIHQPIVNIVEFWLANLPLINFTAINKPHDITTVQRTLLHVAIVVSRISTWFNTLLTRKPNF